MNAIDKRLAEIRKQKAALSKDVSKQKELIGRLSFAEKVLAGVTDAVNSGKAESILRHFVE
jgi:hypothetical protein